MLKKNLTASSALNFSFYYSLLSTFFEVVNTQISFTCNSNDLADDFVYRPNVIRYSRSHCGCHSKASLEVMGDGGSETTFGCNSSIPGSGAPHTTR